MFLVPERKKTFIIIDTTTILQYHKSIVYLSIIHSGKKSPSVHIPNGCHAVRKSPTLTATQPTIKHKPIRRRTDELSRLAMYM